MSAPSGAHTNTLSQVPRTWRHILSTHLARLTGEQLMSACDCDHTTASRIASGQRGATFGQWCSLIDLMGFKVVSKDKQCISPDELRMLRRHYSATTAANLLWEDPE